MNANNAWVNAGHLGHKLTLDGCGLTFRAWRGLDPGPTLFPIAKYYLASKSVTLKDSPQPA